ncbi:hypothetical protein L1987_02490 [Smallanthus sonchifolius]|uniref:Uncharacterized protein n=1 Tax=Smallanthus sonchifolius TaxID=185202 RepID=A0ACB9K7Z3_9ASTR|nr:hypothetical protein L1987_02490 [Smallanthus sonchifolius]
MAAPSSSSSAANIMLAIHEKIWSNSRFVVVQIDDLQIQIVFADKVTYVTSDATDVSYVVMTGEYFVLKCNFGF